MARYCCQLVMSQMPGNADDVIADGGLEGNVGVDVVPAVLDGETALDVGTVPDCDAGVDDAGGAVYVDGLPCAVVAVAAVVVPHPAAVMTNPTMIGAAMAPRNIRMRSPQFPCFSPCLHPRDASSR